MALTWSRWLYRRTRWWHALALSLLTVSLIAYITSLANKAKKVSWSTMPLLDERFFFSPDVVKRTLTSYGPSGRQIYVRINQLDFLLPAVYAAACMAVLSLALSGWVSEEFETLNTVLPLTIALFDYIENIGIAVLLRRYPTFGWFEIHMSSLSSIAGALKWTSFYVCLALIALGLCVQGYRQVKTLLLKGQRHGDRSSKLV